MRLKNQELTTILREYYTNRFFALPLDDLIARPPNFFRACLFFMLKEHLEQLGISPRIIQLSLMDYLDIMRSTTDETMAFIDPIAYQRTQLTIVQVELLLAYLM